MAKPYDLIGKRFGSLVVESRVENNKNGNTQWLCRCDCGGKKIALGYDLTHGRTTTCGCRFGQKGKPSHKRQDLTGRRFGKLAVLSLSDKAGKNGNLYWNCICDCGREYLVSASNLRSGRVWRCKDCIDYNSTLVDLAGKRFGKLTVISRSDNIKNKVAWLCRCDCGNEMVVIGNYLKNGHKKSCGCLSGDSRKILTGEKHLFGKGLSKTRIYQEYRSMLERCSPKFHNHKDYYDRGISVCAEWSNSNGFLNFKEWAFRNGYNDSLSLDRTDNDKGYSPNNCRWVTMKEQQNNKSDNVFITIDGETKTLKQWSEHYGLSYGMIKARRRHGWPEERLFEPKHKNQYK